MTKIAPAAVMLAFMEPPAEFEEEFHAWYDTEHLPQRKALPGFVAAARWECIEGAPRWLASYELTSLAALDSEAYRAVSGPNSTPWSRRMLAKCERPGRMRANCEVVYQSPEGPRPSGPASHLLVACFRGLDAGRVQGSALAAADRFLSLPGEPRCRLLRSDAAASVDLWALVSFAMTATPGELAVASTIDGETAAVFNLYVPYSAQFGPY